MTHRKQWTTHNKRVNKFKMEYVSTVLVLDSDEKIYIHIYVYMYNIYINICIYILKIKNKMKNENSSPMIVIYERCWHIYIVYVKKTNMYVCYIRVHVLYVYIYIYKMIIHFSLCVYAMWAYVYFFCWTYARECVCIKCACRYLCRSLYGEHNW